MFAATLKTSAVSRLRVSTFSSRAKNNSKIKTYEQEAISASKFILLWQGHIIVVTLVWVRIHCESKKEKQDFQAVESRFYN